MPSISQIPTPWPGPDFTVTFKPSKLKIFKRMVLLLPLAGACFWAAQKENDIISLVCGSIILMAPLAGCLQLHPRASYLTLKKDSFVFCSFFRAHEVRWDEVQEFRVKKFSSIEMVLWDYVPGFSKSVKSRQAAKALTGCEGGLPDTYGFKAEELANVMNQMRKLQHLEPSREI